MTAKKPLVASSGKIEQLQAGDALDCGKKSFHGIEAIGAITFDDGTHVLSIATITYWFNGVQYVSASPITGDIDVLSTLVTDTTYFFYFDAAAGALKCNTSPYNFVTQVPVATIFWNGANGAIVYEAHGYTRDLDWHQCAHDTVGTRYQSGLDKTLPTTADDNHLQIESGNIHDEDLDVTILQQTTCRIIYKASLNKYTWVNSALPYAGSGTQPQYLDTDTWLLANVGASDFVCMWVYATMDATRPIYIIPTHASVAYNTIALARAETAPALGSLNLSPEFKLIYRFIYKGDGNFQESNDYRLSQPVPSGGVPNSTAASVSFSPTGDIAATTVQTALEELDTEKVPTARTITTTSPITIDGGASADLSANRTIAIPAASSGVPGHMTGAYATKLDGIAAGANAYVHPNHSGAVTSLADGAQAITDEAVTYAKIQHVSATDKILGRFNAGAGDVEEIDCTAAGRALLDDANAAAQRATLGLGTMAVEAAASYPAKTLWHEQGSIVIASGADTPAELTHGTAGQVLQTGGHGANASWALRDPIKIANPTGTTCTTNEVVDSSETAIDVDSGAKLAIGQVICIFDDVSEIMLVTNIVGNTLTVTRGYAGSASVAHATATAIYVVSVVIADTSTDTVYDCTTSTWPICILFPIFADYVGPKFRVINKSGTNKVYCMPEGAETINGYNASVQITEKYGWWDFAKVQTEWRGNTDGNSTIYYIGAETAFNFSTTDLTYDEDDDLTLTPPKGNYFLDSEFNIYVYDTTSAEVDMYAGLGTVLGNNAPGLCQKRQTLIVTSGTIGLYAPYFYNNVPFTSTDGTTVIYIKSKSSGTSAATIHRSYAAAGIPKYIKARRIS